MVEAEVRAVRLEEAEVVPQGLHVVAVRVARVAEEVVVVMEEAGDRTRVAEGIPMLLGRGGMIAR